MIGSFYIDMLAVQDSRHDLFIAGVYLVSCSSWGEGHREVPVESVSKTVTRGIFPCNSSMGSAPADIKEPFKYAGSVKVRITRARSIAPTLFSCEHTNALVTG